MLCLPGVDVNNIVSNLKSLIYFNMALSNIKLFIKILHQLYFTK